MDDPQAERLIETATRIFAELGFDGTSTQLIADSAGVGMDVLRESAGTKADLYRAVMRRADAAEQEAMRAAMDGFTPSRQGVVALADAYLDFQIARPDVMALWLHRWMGDAADVPGLEDLYTRPLSILVAGAIRDLVPGDVDPDHLVWTVVWCVYGFLSGGIVYSGPGEPWAFRPIRGQTPEGQERASVERFRAHLHTLLDHLLTPLDDRRG
ncbi:TetR/AcrR family transcriptional regulator [Actinomadura rubrisoli]|uniref:TetR/AcrR family transcriptional regulator n=1 Tax=Actinomadura rubrisoli TaxID=2530368 RepID=A0A4R5BS19_9ACTN|nr:TetR/AcrR family transcriptional regulator [Actinomadura rubrisoli]TDD86824.1 TetR/AcrR family transcriptional regulator [Actinomadura rubrisoli]